MAMEIIGNMSEIPGEVTFTWKIKDFFQLSDEIDKGYTSPDFYFAGTSWEISIYPNGMTEYPSEGWISLFLLRTSCGVPINVNFTFTLQEDDSIMHKLSFAHTFDEKSIGIGNSKFIKRSELIEKTSKLVPSNLLAIICTIEKGEEIDIVDSLFRRQQDICNNMYQIYLNGNNTDLKLKFKNNQEITAHRMILETRSPVFAAMFSHDTKEKQTGEIDIKDADANIMTILLEYLYCGDMPILTAENALLLYAAAEKYDVIDIKFICSEFISRNLSVDWVTDVITFSELYQIEEVNRCAREYFKENAGEILKTEKWKDFVKENHDLGVELLSSLVQTLLPTRNNLE